MREELSKIPHLDLVDLLNFSFTNDHVSKRGITLSGKVISPDKKNSRTDKRKTTKC